MNLKLKISLLEAAKWLSLVVVVIFLFTLMSQGKESSTEFSVMAEAVTSVSDLTTVQEADNQMIKRLYGLDPGDYEGILLYNPTTNMGAEEILIVKLADISQQESVKAAIEARVATQMDSFEGYAVEQYEMLQNCVIEVQGNYILLVVAADTAPVRQAFLNAL